MGFALVTINTWKCDGDYKKRLPRLSSGLLHASPHFVACQEVFHAIDETISTKNYLEKMLHMKAYFFPSRSKEREVSGIKCNSYSGLCFFTNLEVILYEEIVLPTTPKDGDRTAQLVIVKYKAKDICIVNTHLTHLKSEEELRKKQLQCIIEKTHHKIFDFFILCGDLNDTYSSSTIQYLLQDNLGLQSVFKNNESTHKSGKQIDYIFYKSNGIIKDIDEKIILNEPSDNILPSDHFGLYASFNIIEL